MGQIYERFRNKQLKYPQSLNGLTDTHTVAVMEANHKNRNIAIGLVKSTDPEEIKELMKSAHGKGYQSGEAILKNPAVKALRGQYNGLCKMTACLSPHNVEWYNWGSYGFYCPSCAHMLNRENRPYARAEGKPDLCSPKTAEEAAELHVM